MVWIFIDAMHSNFSQLMDTSGHSSHDNRGYKISVKISQHSLTKTHTKNDAYLVFLNLRQDKFPYILGPIDVVHLIQI